MNPAIGRLPIVIRGVVRSSSDARPVAGALVIDLADPRSDHPAHETVGNRKANPEAPPLRTDLDGGFQLTGTRLHSGDLRKVLVRADGFFPWARIYAPDEGAQSWEVRLTSCGIVRGTVRTPDGGAAHDAGITAIPWKFAPLDEDGWEYPPRYERLGRPDVPETKTDTAGRFLLQPLVLGRPYLLCVSFPEGTGFTRRIEVQATESAPTAFVEIEIDRRS